jgi:hypothetical protein
MFHNNHASYIQPFTSIQRSGNLHIPLPNFIVSSYVSVLLSTSMKQQCSHYVCFWIFIFGIIFNLPKKLFLEEKPGGLYDGIGNSIIFLLNRPKFRNVSHTQFYLKSVYKCYVKIINIIIIIRQELGLVRPVSASSNNIFKKTPKSSSSILFIIQH